MNECYWKQSGEFEGGLTYSTYCKKEWLTIDTNSIKDSGMIYCPFCGKRIKLKNDRDSFLVGIEREYAQEIIPFKPNEGQKSVWVRGGGVHISPCGCEFNNFEDCFNHNDLECVVYFDNIYKKDKIV